MSTESHELSLFINNDGNLYRQMTQSIIKNLVKRKKKGTYVKELGVQAFRNLADEGAKRYHKQHGSPGRSWFSMFSTSDRDATARELESAFSAEYKVGGYG